MWKQQPTGDSGLINKANVSPAIKFHSLRKLSFIACGMANSPLQSLWYPPYMIPGPEAIKLEFLLYLPADQLTKLVPRKAWNSIDDISKPHPSHYDIRGLLSKQAWRHSWVPRAGYCWGGVCLLLAGANSLVLVKCWGPSVCSPAHCVLWQHDTNILQWVSKKCDE